MACWRDDNKVLSHKIASLEAKLLKALSQEGNSNKSQRQDNVLEASAWGISITENVGRQHLDPWAWWLASSQEEGLKPALRPRFQEE
ncbi:hypothetical protein DSO57_1003858 [Entomophthora muscae]|uniref:Uncharacterized protein n=1 Tax=Entomophthora muscae TaxID=34485 RepID=A0ACC2RNA0_9FUNG|nr:hypothetical protein DSO57_1003858 [Entomophthora muscae]